MNSSYDDEIRNQCVLILNKELDNKISRAVEKDIYNSTIDYASKNNINKSWNSTTFKMIYLSRIRSFYTNLKSDSYVQNLTFKERILNSEIDYKNISKLSNHEVHPLKWADFIKKKIETEKLKYELKPEAMTDMFKCTKCGSRSCTYYEMQTRSADEPMTQFITCLDCNNNWKQ